MSYKELLEFSRTAMTLNLPSTPKEIEAIVHRMSRAVAGHVDEAMIQAVATQLEKEFSVSLGKSHVVAERHEPWLRAKAHEIDSKYWRRYRQFLLSQGYGNAVVNAISDTTDEILDLAGNPELDGEWTRRGLVVGHVQSGKTSNYLALINKAADAGYKLIVLIAGVHSILRSQTQERVDQGFVGRDSDQILNRMANAAMIGVGTINASFSAVAYTSRSADFSRSRADGLNISIHSLREPAIFVIKKHPSILTNLISWLKGANAEGGKLRMPMLVIDDEADNASVNIAKDPERPNTINRLIRELLAISSRNTYIGYTATPFANIFIDPESNHEALGNDLFPRDFIIGLEAPSSYVGARQFFLEEASPSLVVEIDDADDWLDPKHKIGTRVDWLPPSLEEAMDCFIVSKAIRIIRGQGSQHHSMLVNVSRFTGVQGEVARELSNRLHQVRDAIENRYALPVDVALRDPTMASLHQAWEKHYSSEPECWPEVQAALHQAAAGMRVEQINASRSSGRLDYRSYKDVGLNVIAVGGNSLSRGFTLEGLTISYFLRNTQMYDTLLQMGRWFGYRDGYQTLCRLFLSEEAKDWYSFISEATEELRDEIRKMEAAGLTPVDFGLAVRSHPGSLLVTARNKMATANQIIRKVGLANKLVESAVVHADDPARSKNVKCVIRLIEHLLDSGCQRTVIGSASGPHSVLFKGVGLDLVEDFISSFIIHGSNIEMQPDALIEYVRRRNFKDWDVVIASNSAADLDSRLRVGAVEIGFQSRSMVRHRNALQISGNKRRVASRGLEKIGLSETQLAAAEEEHRNAAQDGKAGSTISDRFYRAQRTRPLLMVHLLKALIPKDQDADGKIHAAYGISFPALRPGETEQHVQYTANLIAFRQTYGDLDGDDDDDSDEA